MSAAGSGVAVTAVGRAAMLSVRGGAASAPVEYDGSLGGLATSVGPATADWNSAAAGAAMPSKYVGEVPGVDWADAGTTAPTSSVAAIAVRDFIYWGRKGWGGGVGTGRSNNEQCTRRAPAGPASSLLSQNDLRMKYPH